LRVGCSNKHTDSKKFRELVKEIAILMAYEATADLQVEPVTVETPIATAQGGWYPSCEPGWASSPESGR